MRCFKFFPGGEQNPLLPISIVALVVALIIALAPDFELPQSSRIETMSQQARHWSTVDYYLDHHDGYQVSAAKWTRQVFD